MSRLAFGVGGAVAGSFVGQPQLGFALGSLAGGLFNKPDDIINEGPKVGALPTTTSAFGVNKTIPFGTVPVSGNVIDKSEIRNIPHEEDQDTGGKGIGGGPEVTNVWYTAEIDLDIAIGDEPIDAIVRVYANATLLIDNTPGSANVSPQWLRYQIYLGNEDQLPDPTFEAIRGAGNVPAYRGTPHIVFTNFQLESFNNQIPTFRFVVSTDADEGNSTTTKDFGGGASIGGLLLNTSNSLAYFVNNSPSLGRIAQVYDCYSQSVVFNMRWPDDVDRMDEGGGIGLLSLGLVVSGVDLESPPKSHLFVLTEEGSTAKTSFFDAYTGAYIGSVEDLKRDDENFTAIVSDERKGTIFSQRVSSNGFYSDMKSWTFTYSGGFSPIAYVDNGTVLIPFGRDGINEWAWDAAPSYPYGSNRRGIILVKGRDSVVELQYLCTIDDTNPTNVADMVSVVDGFDIDPVSGNANITKIIWDSVRSLFWVIGVSETDSSATIFRSYDINLNQVDEVVTPFGIYYSSIRNHGYFSEETSDITWTISGEAFSFNTVSLQITNLGSVTTSGSSGSDMSVYHHGTGTIWRMSSGNFLDIIKLSAITDNDVPLSSLFNTLCRRATLNPSQYYTAELDPNTTKGYSIETDGTIRSKMIPLQQAYFIDGVNEGSRINFKFRSTDPVATITADELAVVQSKGSSERTDILIRREMDLKLPGRTEFTYYNKDAEFEQNTQLARREASYVTDNSTQIVVPVVMGNNEAMRRCDIIEHVSHIEREVYEISTFVKYFFLTVGDVIIIIPKDGKTYIGRVIFKSYLGSFVRFVLTRHDSSVLESFLDGGEAEPRNIQVPNNPLTNSVHLDIPLLLESQNNAGYNMAGAGMSDSWTGGNIYKSSNRQTWTLLTSLLRTSNLGTTQNVLPDKASTVWDNTSSLIVNVRPGTVLSSCTEEEALQGNINAVAIGVNGRFEICNFVNAVLTGPNEYTISNFLRGRIGTEIFTGDHTSGEIFAMLSADDLTYITDTLANLTVPFYYRAVSFGQNLYGDQVMEQVHTNNGVCLIPLAPAHFKVVREFNLDLVFTWEPRTRFPLNNFWSADTSDEENYELVVVKNSDGTIVRDITGLTVGTYTYTRVDQLADGLPADDIEILDVTSYHISAIYPLNNSRGYPSTLQTFSGDPPNEYLEYCATIGMYVLWELGEQAGSTEVLDTLGNYDGFTSSSPLREQPSLFDGYGNSTEFFDSARAKGGNIPFDEFDFLNFSISLMVYPLEANTLGDQYFYTSYIDYGSTEADYVRIKWLADGTLEFNHRNTNGTIRTIAWPFQMPLNQTTHFVMTFAAPDSDTFGDFKAYINGSLVGTVQAKLGPGDISGNDALETSLGRATETTNKAVNDFRMQVAMIFDRAVSAPEVSLMYTKTGL